MVNLACLVLTLSFCAGHFALDSSQTSYQDLANDYVNLTSDPVNVIPELNKLNIRCSAASHTVDYVSIVSIILRKWNDAVGMYEELALISMFDPDKPQLVKEMGVSPSGQLQTSGQSYLALDWAVATEDELGTYTCEVNVLDETGHPDNLTSSLRVEMEDVDLVMVLKELYKLKQAQEGHLQEISALRQELKKTEVGDAVAQSTLKDISLELERVDAFASSLAENYTNNPCPCSNSNGDSDVALMNTTVEFCDEIGLCATTFLETPLGSAPYRCYKVETETRAWDIADKNCKDKGGRLAEVPDEATFQVMRSLYGGLLTSNVWLGAYMRDGGDWQWDSGASFNVSTWKVDPWKVGEPHLNGLRGLWMSYEDGSWGDYYYINGMGSLCETNDDAVLCDAW